jgi:hypothetical protein
MRLRSIAALAALLLVPAATASARDEDDLREYARGTWLRSRR